MIEPLFDIKVYLARCASFEIEQLCPRAAENCARKAREAEREELRRAWLIVARDWLAMAAREDAKEPPPNKE